MIYACAFLESSNSSMQTMVWMFMASLQSFDVCRYGVTIRGMLRGKLSF